MAEVSSHLEFSVDFRGSIGDLQPCYKAKGPPGPEQASPRC